MRNQVPWRLPQFLLLHLCLIFPSHLLPLCTRREHFRQQITNESVKAEYNLQSPDVTYRVRPSPFILFTFTSDCRPYHCHLFVLFLLFLKSFFRYNGFKNPVGASDVVYATSALLEMFSSAPSSSSSAAAADSADSTVGGSDGVERQAAFNEAYDCLSMQSEGLLKKGVQCALTLQRVSWIVSCHVMCSLILFSSFVPYHVLSRHVLNCDLLSSSIKSVLCVLKCPLDVAFTPMSILPSSGAATGH